MSRRKAARPKPATQRKPDVDAMLAEGLALHQRGRIPEAESIYRRALAVQPDHAQANQFLGVALLQRGEAASAVELLAKAVELQPDNPQSLCDLGVAQNAAGMFEEAVQSLTRAIELKPDYAQAYSNLGMALKNLHRAEAAVGSYRKAIEFRPNEPGFHHNLGNALTAAGELVEAEAAYRRALELRPGYPAALSGLALTLSELGRTEEAISLGLHAIESRANVGAYHFALGRAYRAAQEPEKAVASFRRALELDPEDLQSLRYIALLERKGAFDTELGQLVRRWDERRLTPEQETNLAYTLGTWFDDLGEYQKAFEFYVHANALKNRGSSFSIEQACSRLKRTRALFEPVSDWPEAEAGEEGPIFIVGLPRAGKTTLEGMLSRHTRVRSAGELKILSLLSRDVSDAYKLTEEGRRIEDVPTSEFGKMARRYMRHLRSIVEEPFLPVDTMPANFGLIGWIRMAMPNAKVIHCTRDTMDHVVEIYKKCFGKSGHDYSNNFQDLNLYYMAYRELMDFWRSTIPGYVLDVAFEDLAADPAGQMRRILAHCQLEYESECGAFVPSEPRVGEPRQTPHDDREARLAPYRAPLASILGA